MKGTGHSGQAKLKLVRKQGPVAYPNLVTFLSEAVRMNDIVLCGVGPDCPGILPLLSSSFPTLERSGLTHVGLEISSGERSVFDSFNKRERSLESLPIPSALDCPDFRELIRSARDADLKVAPVDMPGFVNNPDMSRDWWMARQLELWLQMYPGSRVLAIVGNIHAFKQVEQLEPEAGDLCIRGELKRLSGKRKICSILMECSRRMRPLIPRVIGTGEVSTPVVLETRVIDFRLGPLANTGVKSMIARHAVSAITVL